MMEVKNDRASTWNTWIFGMPSRVWFRTHDRTPFPDVMGCPSHRAPSDEKDSLLGLSPGTRCTHAPRNLLHAWRAPFSRPSSGALHAALCPPPLDPERNVHGPRSIRSIYGLSTVPPPHVPQGGTSFGARPSTFGGLPPGVPPLLTSFSLPSNALDGFGSCRG